MRPFLSLSLALAATAAMAPFAWAHFKLLEPASWIEENNLGDPQKLGPCGGTSANQAKGKAANPGTPTNMVTKAQGGQKLHIKLQETVFHPGHYRIALAVNSRAELPPDPEVVLRDSDKGPQSVSAPIDRSPKPPILVDGLWAHTAKMADPWEVEKELRRKTTVEEDLESCGQYLKMQNLPGLYRNMINEAMEKARPNYDSISQRGKVAFDILKHAESRWNR